MKFNLALGYVVRKQVREQKMPDGGENYWRHDRQMTEMFVRTAITLKYPQGEKDESIQELNADIDEALTLAVNEGHDHVTLERGEVKHVLACVEAWAAPADWHAHVRRLRGAIKKALEDHDLAEKAKKDAPTNGAAEKHAEAAKA